MVRVPIATHQDISAGKISFLCLCTARDSCVGRSDSVKKSVTSVSPSQPARVLLNTSCDRIDPPHSDEVNRIWQVCDYFEVMRILWYELRYREAVEILIQTQSPRCNEDSYTDTIAEVQSFSILASCG